MSILPTSFKLVDFDQFIERLQEDENMFLKQLAKLIDVKSILTLVLTAVFAVLSIRGTISSSEFLSVFTLVVGFYFGVQHERKNSAEAKDE